jgi:hypothetical protein
MKTKLLFFMLFSSVLTLAQTNFESGSYMDLNNVKHEGFIKNLDWKNNPSEIIFKKNIEDADNIYVNSDNLKEFEIYGFSKYKKFNVNIDISANALSEIGYIKDPIFEKKELLLKVLLEGKSSLYLMNYGVYGKYFFNNASQEIEELVYKKYKVNEIDAAKMREDGDKVYAYTTVLTNNEYLKQLFNGVNCNMNREKIYKTSYTETSLVKYFKEYNECSDSEYVTYKSSKKTKTNIKALIAGNFSSLELSNNNRSLYSKNFDNKTTLGAGLELELVFPYNNNKWAAFIETSFNTYKNNAVLTDDKGFSLYEKQDVTVQYNYIQLAPGLRHYFYLNENSKISIDAIYNIKMGVGDNKVEYSREDESLVIYRNLKMTNSMLYNFAFGVNYSYKKYTLGIRTYSKSNVLDRTTDITFAKYSNLSFLFKYSIL